MSDIGRFLPLSQNRRSDESAITGDWAPQVAECVDAIAVMLADLAPEEWNTPAGPEQWRIAASVGHLIDRTTAALRSPMADAVRTMVMNDLTGLVALDPLVRMTPAGRATLVRSLRRVSAELRVPPAEDPHRIRWTGRSKIRRESLRVLTDVVVTGYDIAAAVDRDLEFPSVATGAVALGRVGSAPGAIRAVTRGRTIVATDAGWSFGYGPELSGTAASIIRFLFERAGVPDS